MNNFTEARLEQAIIELLAQQGYPHVAGDQLVREPGEVLIRVDLVKITQRRVSVGREG